MTVREEVTRASIIMAVCVLSHVTKLRLFVTPWTVAHQAPLSMEISKQENWNGMPFPTPGDLLHQGIEQASLASPALAGRFFTTALNWEAPEW